jgi:hypothetical protein
MRQHPESPGPSLEPIRGAPHSVTARELRNALYWGVGYELVVLGASIVLNLYVRSHGGGALSFALFYLFYVLSLPASALGTLYAGSLEGWRVLVGVLGLNLVTATLVALYWVHRRARLRAA